MGHQVLEWGFIRGHIKQLCKFIIAGETAECGDELDDDFVELFNDLTKEMENMDDQVIRAGYANFNNEEWTSEINADKVDWRGASIEASSLNILLKGKWKCWVVMTIMTKMETIDPCSAIMKP